MKKKILTKILIFNHHKNILFFTIHKAGSMFIHRICHELSDLSTMIHYSPNGGDIPIPSEEIPYDPDFWKNKKGCFGPLRYYYNIPNIYDYSIILHLRDPRDVLTSMFYSFCYMHPGEIKSCTGYRKEIADRGIDKFVLQLAKGIRTKDYLIQLYGTGRGKNLFERYRDYINNLLDKPNVTFVKYEEMVTDFESWLKKVIIPFSIPRKENVVKNLVKKYKDEFTVVHENKWEHKRKVTPGDYKEKLKPETIEELNSIFKEILKKLKY